MKTTFAQLQFVTPQGTIADIPGSSGMLSLPPDLPPPALLRLARREVREAGRDGVARIEIIRDGRTVAYGAA